MNGPVVINNSKTDSTGVLLGAYPSERGITGSRVNVAKLLSKIQRLSSGVTVSLGAPGQIWSGPYLYIFIESHMLIN